MDYPKTIKRSVIAKKSVARIAIRQRIQPYCAVSRNRHDKPSAIRAQATPNG
jgi:hypothetical protein